MTAKPDLDDYKTVPERIAEFRAKYPDGCLRPADMAHPFVIREMPDGQAVVIVVAAAYRRPDDPLPGIGMASEPYPGRTPYTRNSELMNAETSAWGRAIVAALAADTSKIASRDEVRNRQAERDGEPRPRSRAVTDKQLAGEGRMTRGQAAEHKQLEADTKRQPQRAERVRPRGPDPDSDPWATDAPVDGERAQQLRQSIPDHEPEDKPGSILDGQKRALERLLGMLGVESREDRHDAVALAIGLPALTFSTLKPGERGAPSCNQAGEAIRELDRQAAAEREASRA
jgi:hypothetical protein